MTRATAQPRRARGVGVPSGEPGPLPPGTGSADDLPVPPRPLRLVLAALLGCASVLLVVRPPEIDGVPAAAALLLVAWVACSALLVDAARGGLYRASSVYLMMFGLFHGGLLVAVALRGASAFTASSESSNLWLYSSSTSEAVELVVLGMAAFSVSTTFAPLTIRSRPRSESPASAAVQRRVLGLIGPILAVLGICLFLGVLVVGGRGLLLSGYTTFLKDAQQSPGYAYSHVLIGLGTAFSIVAGGRARTIGWAGFVAYALIAFPLGLRGEVLFPLVALLVVEARCGRRASRTVTAVGAVVVLFLISTVRQTRLGGIGALFTTSSLASPIDAIAEMGYSLRPAVVVATWHAHGEPFAGGWSVAAPPTRFVEKLFGLPDAVPSSASLFTVEIAQRAGAIGGSPIAEAYHDFGAVGVGLLMALFGLVLGRMESRVPSVRHDAALVVFLIPLLVQIRNGLLPMLVQISIGAVVLLVCGAFGRRRDRRPAPRGS